VLIATIIWTVVTTKEYPPEFYNTDTEESKEKKKFKIPATMLQLLVVQFFSWFALFSMWVYTTPAVAREFFNVTDPSLPAYQEAGDWVGILFGIYNGVSAVIALSLPKIAAKLGRKATHAIALSIGGLSFLSFAIIPSANLLWIPMIGVGIAWGSILAMPYAMLASSIPAKKMGVFMGLFNMSITIPQIVNGVFSGLMLKYWFNDNPVNSIYFAGVLMILAAASTFFVKEKLSIKLDS